MKDHDLSDELKSFVYKAERAANESMEIIEKVRKLRKIEKEEEVEQINLKSVVDRVISEHHDQLEEKDIDMSIKKLKCDLRGGTLLEELFSNLIENSIQHSDCDEIKISSKCEEDECIVKVEDDGIGISDDIKDKIFEKGFKKGEHEGTGLGLYMVKEIVDNYGGSVEVKDSETGGTRFDVRLKKDE